MSKYTDRLWSDLAREHGPSLQRAASPKPASRSRRPRLLAGSTLAVAGAGVALALALTATGSTPAFAVTQTADGSVLVTMSQSHALPQVNAELTKMGIHEQIGVAMASGPATVKGPVACTQRPGVSGPTVKVLVGTDGTQVITAANSVGNTGIGTWHVATCVAMGDAASGWTGNTGIG